MDVVTLSQPLPAHYNKVSLERAKRKQLNSKTEHVQRTWGIGHSQVWSGRETASQGLYDQRLNLLICELWT